MAFLSHGLSSVRDGLSQTNQKSYSRWANTSPRVVFLAVDESSAEFFAMIFNNLKQIGKPVPTNDVWIAASAMQHGRTLATLDSHFKYITGLSLHPALERIQP
ncbi:MAG: PIN domain-containing protein [Desulfuromonadaceae bacterium]